MSNETSFTARTMPAAPRKPPLTEKYLVRLRTDSTGAAVLAAKFNPVPPAAAQLILLAAISWCRWQRDRPPVSVGKSGGSWSQTGMRYGHRGAKRHPAETF